jgi:probable metal-binding protein
MACRWASCIISAKRAATHDKGMATQIRPVMGHEVLNLLAYAGGRCSIEDLRCSAGVRFGREAVYGNCHGDFFSFDELLDFLEAKGKLAVEGGDVAIGRVPGCSGH